MATTLFLRSGISSLDPTSAIGSLADHRALSLTRGAGVVSTVDSTLSAATGTRIEGWGFKNSAAKEIWWISEPLNAVTISGTITPNIRALESNALANYGVGISISVLPSPGTGAESVLIVPETAVGLELGTSEAARTSSITPTSTAISTGDRLIVHIWWYAAGGTSASGRTATGFWNGASGATGDSFVTFTEALTEVVVPDSGFPFIGGGYYP